MNGELFSLKPGQRLDGIPHKAWNAFVEAARYVKGQKESLGRTPLRDVPQTGIVRVKNCTGEDRERFDVLGIDDVFPAPTDNPSGFKSGPVLHGDVPDTEKHRGRFVVLLEPAKDGGIVSACISGITIARVRIEEDEDWLTSADIDGTESGQLKASVQGSAKILWREDGTGTVWAVARLANTERHHYLARIPEGGIPARQGLQTGSVECDLFAADDTGLLEPVRRPGGETVQITVHHHGTQPIRGPVTSSQMQYLGVTFDGADSWLLDPPKQTLLCVPTKRVRAKSWGSARELRFVDGRWMPIGSVVSVYNVCDYALLASQQIVCHFHEDTSAYLSLGCRCCDGSSSSSSSSSDSSSDSDSSISSHSLSSSSSSGPSSSASSSSSSSASSSISSSASSSISSSSESSGSSSASSSGSPSASSQSLSGSPSQSSGSTSGSINISGGSSSGSSLSSSSGSSNSSGVSGSSSSSGSSSQSSHSDSKSDSTSGSPPSSDGPSGSTIDIPSSGSDSASRDGSNSFSDSHSVSESDSRPSTSDSNPPSEPPGSSSSGCTSSWIWSCGWELLDSNCDDPEPPEEPGGYDGALMETAA